MITVDSLRARVRRLREISISLARDTVKPPDASLLWPDEHKAYGAGLREAMLGLHKAKVVLVLAIQRIEGERDGGEGGLTPAPMP
jgi:hypothetical protein